MPHPVPTINELGDDFWLGGMTTFDNYISPWLDLHPDAVEELLCCDADSVEDARRRGAEGVRYAREWAAYLEERGCTFDECC